MVTSKSAEVAVEKSAKTFEQKLARIYEVTGAGTDSALANILGIKAPSVAAARKRRQIPGGWVERIAEKYRANANWLLFGEGPKLIAEIFTQAPEAARLSKNYRQVPVIGLATCGIRGWYNPSPLAITTPLPMPDASDKVFAVLAVGHSLVPAGLKPGHVAFCDPDVKPEHNDLIFIERADGRASLKRFKGREDEWLTIEGWLEPDDKGQQLPYLERFSADSLKCLASVIFIRIKA